MKRKNLLNSFVKWFDMKKISILTIMIFIMSMLPIWYLAFYARPSGDDYGYSMASHQAWISTHSLIEVFKAGFNTTKNMLRTWNGDWVTVFLFTLMPEVFAPYSFWVVPLFMTGIVIAATFYFAKEVLVSRLGLKWYEAAMASSMALIACYQFIPSTAIGMYWYVGAMHYMMPHAVALVVLAYLSKFERTGKIRYIVYSTVGTIIIGGSSYFSAFLVLLVYIMAMLLWFRSDRKLVLIGIPFASGIIALIIQILMPGNASRGGAGFGANAGMLFMTVFKALEQGLLGIWKYFQTKTFVFLLLLVFAVFMWECLNRLESSMMFKWPALFVVFMYGIYASMYTPEIYVTVEVSLGPATMEYFAFVLTAMASIVYVEGWLVNKKKKRNNQEAGVWDEISYRKKVLMPVCCICVLIVIINRGMLSNSVFKECCDYVLSGQASDFKEQIDSQMKILLDDTVKEAYLCPVNEEQGPLMHMPVTDDPDAFTNWAVAGFYGKDLVVMEKESSE